MSNIHENEILSDNTQNYAQCKTCRHRVSLMVRGKEVGYDKAFCEAYPKHKPDGVKFIWKFTPCPKYEKEIEVQS